MDQVATTTLELPGLGARKYDLVVGQLVMPLPNDPVLDDLNVEILCDGQLTVAASPHSRWARRRNAKRLPLKRLPLNLADRPFPLAIVTLKNRTMSPVVERFIECLRDFTQQMRADEMATRR